MDVALGLERWFAEYEHGADVMLAESGVLAPGGPFGFPDRLRIGFGLATDGLERGLDRVARVIERRAAE